VPRTAPSPTVDEVRARSSAALTQLATLLGYPPQWGAELERRAFAAGRAWSTRDDADAGRRHARA
jgi:hypothetical protein